VTGGILSVDKDPIQAVVAMLNHIEGKRKKLGI